MDVIVNPPKPGEPSYESHKAQKETVLTGLAARAKLVAETFNSMEGKRSKYKSFFAKDTFAMWDVHIITFYIVSLEGT